MYLSLNQRIHPSNTINNISIKEMWTWSLLCLKFHLPAISCWNRKIEIPGNEFLDSGPRLHSVKYICLETVSSCTVRKDAGWKLERTNMVIPLHRNRMMFSLAMIWMKKELEILPLHSMMSQRPKALFWSGTTIVQIWSRNDSEVRRNNILVICGMVH